MQFFRNIASNIYGFSARSSRGIKESTHATYNWISYKALTFCTYYHFNRLLTACIRIGLDVNAKGYYNNTPLHMAAEYKNAAAIKILIANKAEVNATNDDDSTPLHVAVKHWDLFNLKGIIAIFKNAGANMNAQDKYSKRTPLASLFSRGTLRAHANYLPEVTAALITAGSDPAVRDSSNKTTLELAMYYDNAQIFEGYIAAGVDLDATLINGLPLLDYALQEGKKAVANTLISVVDINQNTTLHLATRKGNLTATVSLIKAGANVFALDKDNRTPFYEAAKKYQESMVAGKIATAYDYLQICVALINQGKVSDYVKIYTVVLNSAFSRCNSEQFTLLHYAATKCDNPIFVAELLDLNFSVPMYIAFQDGRVNTKQARLTTDRAGNLPLHIAIANNKIAVALALIAPDIAEYKLKKSVNSVNPAGRTPLFDAVENDNKVLFDALLQAGAVDEHKDKASGNTALIQAIINGKREMALALIPRSDVSALNKSTLPALYYAAINDDDELIQALRAAGATFKRVFVYAGGVINDTLLHHEAETAVDNEVIATLLRNGADITALNDKGETCLHAAARNPVFNTAEILIQNRVPVNTRDTIYKKTALHIAAEHDNAAVATSIVKAPDILIDKRNKGQATALHTAAEMKSAKVAQVLLDAGSNPELRLDNGRTVLHQAVTHGSTAVVHLLLAKNVNVMTRDTEGKTPLFSAWYLSDKISQMIMAHKKQHAMPVDEVDSQGKSLMHYIASRIRLTPYDFKKLVEYGVAIDPIDEAGNTPLNILAANKDIRHRGLQKRTLMKTLLMYGASLGAPYRNPTDKLPAGVAPAITLKASKYYSPRGIQDIQGTLFYMAHKIFNQAKAKYLSKSGKEIKSFERIGSAGAERILEYWLGNSEFVKPVADKILDQYRTKKIKEKANLKKDGRATANRPTLS